MNFEEANPLPSVENLHEELARMRGALQRSQQVEAELDRRVFHLKTLYDVSKDLFASIEPEPILRNGLLMAMGNFGVAEGFALLADPSTPTLQECIVLGFKPADAIRLQTLMMQRLSAESSCVLHPLAGRLPPDGDLPDSVALVVPFEVASDCIGVLALGRKLVEAGFSENDRELIDTLANNLRVALKNARSFAQIKALNLKLEDQNRELEQTLRNLKTALRKVEILEGIKSNLSKFLPAGVTRLAEMTPAGQRLDARERDTSVLFLDIEGYTRLTEQMGASRINALTERYFSVFMDAIFDNHGDVVETAGDGLMVLFLGEDRRQHALEAVRTAQTIMAKTCQVNLECRIDSQPVLVNIGICSGRAFVGASKFESLSGRRWTYTAHGTPVNIAARLCGHATGGTALVSKSTAERIKDQFPLLPVGKLSLKNLSEEVEAFAFESTP